MSASTPRNQKAGSAPDLIERLGPGLDSLLGPDARVETVCEGFIWSEGPVWKDGCLFFSDVPANIMYRWTPGAARAEVFLEPSGGIASNPDFREPGSNGLALDAEGRLLVCQHGARRVIRIEKDGRTQTVLADRFEGRRLNNPNDLICHSSGAVYFTDPSYGFAGMEASPLKEIPWNGVYRVKPGGVIELFTKELPLPNGLALSPDERILYVAVSDAALPRIMAFELNEDGLAAGSGRLFFDAVPLIRRGLRGTCDGFKIDAHGNIFTTVPGGVAVLSPQGDHLGTILLGVTSNCAWGDDGSTLYITASDRVCRIRTKTRGCRFGS